MEKIESFFKFEITQTTTVVLYKINNGNGKRWTVEGCEADGHMVLREINYPENNVDVIITPGALKITTVRGYEYQITDLEGDGAEVVFHGPVNALLTQSLMPRLTYVPETLLATGSDMDCYVPIGEFMAHREKRHADRINPQDKFGWRVNMKFNNELVPWLPSFKAERRDKQAKRKSGKFARG